MPGLLRAGRARFGLAAGAWRAHGEAGEAAVFQGTVQRGLHDRLTMQGGAQLAPDYAQAIAGAAFATRIGALAIDRAHSRSSPHADRAVGGSTRVRFATQFLPTRTQVDIGAWRRAHGTWRSLDDAMRTRHAPTDRPVRLERERIEASIQQAFGARRHALRLAMVDRRFDPGDDTRSLQLAYAAPVFRGGAQLHALVEHARAGHARDAGRGDSTQATLSLSVPLETQRADAPTFLQAHARGGPGRVALQSGVGGAFGRDARNAWRVGLSHAQASTIASGSLGHAGRAGQLVAAWSGGKDHAQWSLSGEGGAVLHARGLTFGPSLGETAALVRAPDGAGARVLHAAHARLDRKGFALVPHLTPYLRNRVGIDPGGAAHDVAFDWTERDVFPRTGALVGVTVPTRRANTRFVRIFDDTGAPAPFGARIVDASGAARGHVGRDGLALLDAIERNATSLAIEWQDGDDARRCTFANPDDPSHHAPGDIPAITCTGESGG
jgi:outer membrane usher protein